MKRQSPQGQRRVLEAITTDSRAKLPLSQSAIYHRVRVGSVYTYHPFPIDRFDPRSDAVEGQRVRVVNLHGAPKANTMGHCHIESLEGAFLGMVHVNSLTKE